MNKIFTLALLLSFSVPFSFLAKAQQSNVDGLSQENAGTDAAKLYHNALGKQEHIYSGSEYVDYDLRKEGHQFYLTDQWTQSSVAFDGMEYSNVPVLYNIVTDEVIVGQINESGFLNKIKIDKNRVSQFDLNGSMFIHLKDTAVEDGFYQLLYKGQTQFLAKRKKTYKKEVVTLTFPEQNTFYLVKDGQFHVVKSKRSVLKLFKDHKKELSEYLKANHIVFSQNREYAIVKLAEQYDLLNNHL